MAAEAIHQDTVCVAVGKDAEESKHTLSWALQYFPGQKLLLLHVHQPSNMFIPLVSGSFPVISFGENEHCSNRELERKIMNMILDNYLLFCRQAGVDAEKLCIEMDDIGEGIVELVYKHNIKKLVMGGAASQHYSEGMVDLKSKKAIYVSQLLACQIWFTCKGHLIYTGYGDLAGSESLLFQSSSTVETGQSSQNRSSARPSGYLIDSSTDNDDDECEVVQSSIILDEEEEEEEADYHHLSTSRALANAVIENSRGDVSDESVGNGQGGEIAIETICRAKALESLYTNELRHRKEIEEDLTKEKENLKKMKRQWDEERLSIMDQKLLLEVEVARLQHNLKELQSELLSAEEVLEVHRKEQDYVWEVPDIALNVTDELLRNQAGAASSLNMNQLFSKFSFAEIEQATSGFDPSSKILEGRHGSVYKGYLHHTPVAIKVLKSDSMQGTAEFLQQVDALSKLRHPNLVTLIGVCPDDSALIFEYLVNGNLEDRLSCKSNTPPLSWQTRVNIATQLCSVLVFLHSRNPPVIVHGDLKPANILLDANFICKLAEFRISHENSSCRTDPSASTSSLDPYSVETGELSPKSDIYSFGLILLQLLTGRTDVLDVQQEMEATLDEGNFKDLLDPLAGEWPYVQAQQLAYIALRCCDVNRDNRPDLVSQVWRVLEAMRSSCGAFSSFHLGPEGSSNPPPYFICPIYQEVMQNPHVAADGYTYEEEALRGWLESGHDTSPMTNIKLEHLNLVPNRALRSAIQEWLQQQ